MTSRPVKLSRRPNSALSPSAPPNSGGTRGGGRGGVYSSRLRTQSAGAAAEGLDGLERTRGAQGRGIWGGRGRGAVGSGGGRGGGAGEASSGARPETAVVALQSLHALLERERGGAAEGHHRS